MGMTPNHAPSSEIRPERSGNLSRSGSRSTWSRGSAGRNDARREAHRDARRDARRNAGPDLLRGPGFLRSSAIVPILVLGLFWAPGLLSAPSLSWAPIPSWWGLGEGELAAQVSAELTTEALDGLEFRTIGPAAMSGRIVDLAVVEEDVDVFYVASSTGGVWKTVDRGTTLEPVFERQGTHSVGDIAVHQGDTSVVWVGTGERANRQSTSWGDGVYKSTDGGETWSHMGLRESYHVGRIRMHPLDPDIVYVAAMGRLWGPNEERGLYKSVDGGETWEKVLHVDENTGVVDVALDPRDPEIVYAASYQRRRRPHGFNGGGPGSGLWKSTDGGSSWTKLGPPEPKEDGPQEPASCFVDPETTVHGANGLPLGEYGRIGITIYRSDPSIVYVSIEQGCRYNASTAYEQRRAGIYRTEDRGETWTWQSDWNPRPMYASQPLVDPNDDRRIYMMNSYSWSDDRGKTFTRPSQSLHGDDRLVWVNPHNSQHVMKADDGGLGISYDRGVTWIYVTDLPVSQYYRVSVDTRRPYRVYGGLQDNGSWYGPSATYRASGILNADWVKTGGGDGFVNLVDTTTNRWLYNESQYLGLQRVDLETGRTRDIRPGDPTGHIGPRWNWGTWPDPYGEGERLGNAMEPANWDGPFILSPHDLSTIYAGTDELWVSRDRGDTWRSLGKLTTDRRLSELPIMGEVTDSSTLSAGDGMPYWPTLSAIAESPVREGVLYVGTDDGLLHVSRDGGESFTEVSGSVPGLPDGAWISYLEPSRVEEGRVYLVAHDYRNDDFSNYVYVSEDHGTSWRPIDGDLPAERVARVLREDLRNPDLLYLGTELGFFVSFDRGERWTEVRSGLPTVAVNDIALQPHYNDLVLGTHSRGIWILDQLSALQEASADALAQPAHLFSIRTAEQIRYDSEIGHTGDLFYRGENPPAGAILDYWLASEHPEGEGVEITVHEAGGEEVARIDDPPGQAGMNRAVWDLRHSLPEEMEEEEEGGFFRMRGPFVVPGTYTVRLSADGATSEGEVEVREDPRLDVPPGERRAWTEALLELVELARQASEGVERAEALTEEAEEGTSEAERAQEHLDDWEELRSRIVRLSSEAGDWVGPFTADQRSQVEFYREMLGTLTGELEDLED